MQCSLTIVVLTFLTWLSIGLYVGGGYSGLGQTLDLFESYGPPKGYGNPALDDPPNMWTNPDTGKYEPVDASKPGNRVPKVFSSIQYFLIAWAVFMGLNSIILAIDSVRSRKAIKSRVYKGGRTSDSSISCTAFLVGYCIILSIIWIVQACFCVLPVLEYRITAQRCWDLDNPAFASATGDICVDFVQYGLILFKDTNYDGYALMCGPNGDYYPARGNLKGFCETYYPTFISFALSMTGAGLGAITMLLYAAHLSSNFSYLKIRRFEKATYLARAPSRSPRKTPSRGSRRSISDRAHQFDTPLKPGQPGYRYTYVPAAQENGVNMYNPNYSSSIIETEPPKPVPEVMSFQKYRDDDDEDEIEMRTIASEKEKVLTYSDPGSDLERSRGRQYTPSPPPYDLGVGEYDRGDRRSERSSTRNRPGNRKPNKRTGSQRHGPDSTYDMASSDENASAGYSSSRRDRPRSRRSKHRRRLESDVDNESDVNDSEDDYVSRASSRPRHYRSKRSGSTARLYDEDSPGSDFYADEDRNRRNSSRKY